MTSSRNIALLAACVLLAASAAGAADAGAGSPVPAARTLFAARADAIRAASAKDGAAFAGFLSDFDTLETSAREAWGGIAEEFGAIRLADFFAGANVLVGPVSRDRKTSAWSGVLGLYNPWWDAILLLRLDDDLLVDRLVLLGGEAFRGEETPSAAGKGEAARRPAAAGAVVPVAEPLSRTLLRVQAKTAARFRELYPEDGVAESAWIPPRGVSRDRTAVRARADLRLKLLRGFVALGSSGDGPGAAMADVASKIRDALRKADAPRLKRLFAAPGCEIFCETFAGFPAFVRDGFGLYGYVPAKEGTLLVFLNPAMPRVYAAVAFPAGREKDADAGNVAFEWFDLATAEKLPTDCREGLENSK